MNMGKAENEEIRLILESVFRHPKWGRSGDARSGYANISRRRESNVASCAAQREEAKLSTTLSLPLFAATMIVFKVAAVFLVCNNGYATIDWRSAYVGR